MTRARTRNSEPARLRAAFQQIAAVLREETHNDASLFRTISTLAQSNPVLASVLAGNIASILDNAHGDVIYTDVLIEAYRISLFERVEGEMFYDAFDGNVNDAEQFASNFKRIAISGEVTAFIRASSTAH